MKILPKRLFRLEQLQKISGSDFLQLLNGNALGRLSNQLNLKRVDYILRVRRKFMQEKFENIINNMVYYYIPREYAMKSRTGMAKPDGKAAIAVDVRVGDILTMKKKHPCGENRFLVLRSGMDFRIRCTGCGHELMVPRPKCEKNIKSILHNDKNGANG